jgi:glycine C-acetyltransferase
VRVGDEALARLVSRRLPDLEVIANLVEYPAVAKGAARFRMQVQANHTEQNIRDAVYAMAVARARAMQELEAIEQPKALAVA